MEEEKNKIILKNLIDKGIDSKNIPMLSLPFLDWLNSYNWSEYDYIEFGSGESTNYMSERFKSVDTIETNFEYYKDIFLKKNNNVNIFYITARDVDFGNYELSINEKTIVMIDSDTNRFLTTKNLLLKIKPSIIILDNSEWFPNTCKLLNDYAYMEIPFWGIRPEDFDEKCTSVFIKKHYSLPKKNYKFFTKGSSLILDNIHDSNISIH
jgi:hypothetical protein